MQEIPRPLLVLHGNRDLRDRLREVAESERLAFRLVSSWDDLLDEVSTAPATSLIVVDPYEQNDGDSAPSIELASLLNRFPSLTITAALTVGRGRMNDVLRLGQWGVVQIVDLEEDLSAVALGRRLMEARGRRLHGLVEQSLPSFTSASARAILSAASRIVSNGGQGRDLAKALNITPRTLTRWCRRAGLPPPKRLLTWMRILLAAEFLDDPGRSVSAVAEACGYAADGSLRLALRRFTGLTPSELREGGAFGIASTAFIEELAQALAPQRRYRAPSRPKPRKSE